MVRINGGVLSVVSMNVCSIEFVVVPGVLGFSG